MSWLISASLRFRLLVVAIAIGLIVHGVRTASEIPLDVFPEFAPPVVEIQTESPGLSTEQVESLVSVPIENSLTGIPYVDVIRSKSVLGLSSIRLIFARDRSARRQTTGAGEIDAQCHAFAGGRSAARHLAAVVVAQSGDEDRY